WVGVVLERLRQLLAIGGKQRSSHQAIAERGPVEERSRKNMQNIEPAAYLSRVFDNEIGGEVRPEMFGPFERIVELTVGHRARFEPEIGRASCRAKERYSMG